VTENLKKICNFFGTKQGLKGLKKNRLRSPHPKSATRHPRHAWSPQSTDTLAAACRTATERGDTLTSRDRTSEPCLLGQLGHSVPAKVDVVVSLLAARPSVPIPSLAYPATNRFLLVATRRQPKAARPPSSPARSDASPASRSPARSF